MTYLSFGSFSYFGELVLKYGAHINKLPVFLHLAQELSFPLDTFHKVVVERQYSTMLAIQDDPGVGFRKAIEFQGGVSTTMGTEATTTLGVILPIGVPTVIHVKTVRCIVQRLFPVYLLLMI
ncbi:hypothetical protein RB195_026031 [Necator americanus]|uniref:Uncharacterized protein n=1 Tax=Necator americanus TaxID=51031 RepID=A0ABR1EV95_NECAM